MLEQGWRWAARRVGVACFALLMVAASVMLGQDVPAGDASKSADSAQPVRRDYRFEVVSIRATDPPNGKEYPNGVVPPTYTPGHYRELKISLASLVAKAFGVRHSYKMECPPWMGATYFTVNATVPEGATKDDLPVMIQHLLEDRFSLKHHHETRQVAGYYLVVAKSGAKVTKSAGPPPDKSMTPGPKFEFDKNGVPHFGKYETGQIYIGPTATWQGRNRSMQGLASDLADRLNLPVRDATGLEGEYDYTLTYTTGEEMYAPGYVPTAGAEAAAPADHPLLRDALEEELGLKLEPVKDISIDVVVVDSANRVPTEN